MALRRGKSACDHSTLRVHALGLVGQPAAQESYHRSPGAFTMGRERGDRVRIKSFKTGLRVEHEVFSVALKVHPDAFLGHSAELVVKLVSR